MNKSLISKATFIALLPFFYFWYFISGIIPRDKKLWVFGSWNGVRFADNSKWLFHYCHSQGSPDTHYIWISKKKKIVKELQSSGYKCAFLYSLKGLWYVSRAGIYVFDMFSSDISYWTSRNAVKVLLMHGIPIKKIGRDIDNKNNLMYKCYHGSNLEKLVLKILRPWWVEKYDLVPSTSPYTSDKFKSAFALSDNESPVTGFSRNDILFSKKEGTETNNKNVAHHCDKQVIYMPTFRDSDRANRNIPIDWSRINNLFKEHNAIFMLKLHPNEKFDVDLSNYNNLKIVDKDVDVYHLLKESDLLITDYSSVSLDFIGTRKPVLLYTYDLEEYCLNDRSLYIDFDDLFMELPIARTFEQLYKQLQQYLSNELNDFGNLDALLSQFHTFTDHLASHRIRQEIEKCTS
ncbi:CDP-glycerol glycerophosphotransferase family protein [Pontibacter locisalis]|uniref:CDP-glycerol glycerophosphotransferase family protein n=1 Tax=Pontibacter locisalis TaxID=1719035 RepID=A0ABW5IHB8_9BACT